MAREDRDPTRVLRFGSSHRDGILMLLVGIALSSIGVWMFQAPTQPMDRLYGVLIVVLGAVIAAVAVLGLRSPSSATLTLSPHGVRFTDLSDRLIPWSEIRDVRTGLDPRGPAYIPRYVSTITVSKPFYDTLGSFWPHSSAVSVKLYDVWNPFNTYGNVVEVDGDSVRIPIARRLRSASASQLHAEIESRWRSFGGGLGRP